MSFKKIVIVGLGLMGGSLAAACRKKFPQARITGVSRNSAALKTALGKKWIHEASRDLRAAAASADLIILCTPVDTARSFLQKIERVAKPGACVTDVGSVKGSLCAWARSRKFKNIHFVGAHPMAGSHLHGINAAHPDLYNHGFTFVTPFPGINKSAFARVKAFWKKISPRVVEITPEQHDIAVAEISHLPHAAASAIVRAVQRKSLPYAVGGFRDSTRIAAGHPSVWVPIFMENRKSVLRVLKNLEKELRTFSKALGRKDSAALSRILSDAMNRRNSLKTSS